MKHPATHIQGMLGITLDDLCSRWNFPLPNYIKIDVGGTKLSIIEGAMNVLSSHR